MIRVWGRNLNIPRKRSKQKIGVPIEEKLLVTKLIQAIGKRPLKHKTIIASELDCFQGIADVVAGTYNGYRLFPNVTSKKLSRLSFSTSRILFALSGKKKIDISQISRITGLSTSTIRAELSLLKKLQILEVENGQVAIRHVIRPPFNEIEAYEVKVKDWKSGIYQARNYRSFAHKVSVALPMARAALLKERLQEFRRMRVGLVGISPKGDLKWILRPRRQRPISGSRNFLAAVSLLKTAN
jgi:hypothetical protein